MPDFVYVFFHVSSRFQFNQVIMHPFVITYAFHNSTWILLVKKDYRYIAVEYNKMSKTWRATYGAFFLIYLQKMYHEISIMLYIRYTFTFRLS